MSAAMLGVAQLVALDGCTLRGMKILGFARRPRRYKRDLFDDLPLEIRWRAEGWLAEFCRRWKGNLPSWRRAILIGRARWLALNPPTSEWGRAMLARLGGLRVQELYREQGRTGEKHPSHKAARISVAHRKRARELKQEAEQRERLGLGPKPRTAYLPVG